ncbi:MAG: hypothetical protein IAE90_07005 [Ignavibacteria bacterium]|mgnify:CR=1 FL=1|nr:hypothetical protein [Ignavibacteria bacterium]
MIKIALFVLILFGSIFPALSQDINLYQPKLKLKENHLLQEPGQTNSHIGYLSQPHGMPYYNKSGLPTGTAVAGIIFLLVNPILVFEDKKIFWGLTKELSKSIYPYGRLSFEYSFLFRTFNKNHFRFAYNYDLIYQQGSSWLMFVISLGAGYFTDTENKGAFAQTSMGFFIPTPVFLIHPYLKYRFTKISKENKSDIHDLSLGAGFVF